MDGELDQVDKITARSKSSNSWAAWRYVSPEHNAMVDAMIAAPIHILCSMRVKTEWVVERDEKGKSVPRAVGLQPEHRRTLSLYDLEYTLCAFAAMADDVDNPEQKAELLEELGSALRQAKDKRDRVTAFLRPCKSQEAFADEEIERLRNRRDRISLVRSELEAYVVQVIEQRRAGQTGRPEARRQPLEPAHPAES